ncbi:MAG: hypothetical protein KAI45_12345, partial [Melioribacteraceae bacterium]|nr:hypothetical protein [Melioribacteraceae bacterium]
IGELVIENKATNFKKFAQCDNSKCKKTFLLNSEDLVSNNGLLLCPDCLLKVSIHHSVQCTSCLAVVNFIEAEPGETPILFYVEKCTHCSGTLEDEKHIVPRYYPEAFV